MRPCIAALCLSLLAAPGHAQQANDAPIMGSQSSDVNDQSTEEFRSVLVIGDGLAGGLGAGLVRMAEDGSNAEIVNRFQESSGLARPEVYDWTEALPKIMGGKDFTDVVILIGVNDRQPIRAGDARHDFGTPEWAQAYLANAEGLLDVLNLAGVKIHWVALPPMGDAKYDSDMKAVAALQKQAAESKGAAYVDLRKDFSAPDGNYTDTGPDDTGVVRKLRASDGITFYKQGNNRFAQLVLATFAKEREPQAPAVAQPQDAPSAAPEFGMASEDGTISTYRPEAQRVAENAVASPPLSPKAPLSRNDVLAGSAAERLFVKGEADPAPAGRFDDFTFTKPAE
jgi:uncharacterized protein